MIHCELCAAMKQAKWEVCGVGETEMSKLSWHVCDEHFVASANRLTRYWLAVQGQRIVARPLSEDCGEAKAGGWPSAVPHSALINKLFASSAQHEILDQLAELHNRIEQREKYDDEQYAEWAKELFQMGNDIGRLLAWSKMLEKRVKALEQHGKTDE